LIAFGGFSFAKQLLKNFSVFVLQYKSEHQNIIDRQFALIALSFSNSSMTSGGNGMNFVTVFFFTRFTRSSVITLLLLAVLEFPSSISTELLAFCQKTGQSSMAQQSHMICSNKQS
jgi:hypothetical protein